MSGVPGDQQQLPFTAAGSLDIYFHYLGADNFGPVSVYFDYIQGRAGVAVTSGYLLVGPTISTPAQRLTVLAGDLLVYSLRIVGGTVATQSLTSPASSVSTVPYSNEADTNWTWAGFPNDPRQENPIANAALRFTADAVVVVPPTPVVLPTYGTLAQSFEGTKVFFKRSV